MIYRPEQLTALLNALAKHVHLLYVPVSLCAMNVLRRGEATGLRWQDVDLETGTAFIQANLTPGRGGGFLKIVKSKRAR